jgi:hypothetical protein
MSPYGSLCFRGTAGDHWHLSVLPGTYPSWQRGFLPVSATRLRRYRCAVSQDERSNAASAASASHSGRTKGGRDCVAEPIRPGNAGSYPSRQRCFAATAARSAETKGTALFLPVLPTPLRGYCCAVRQNERQLPYGSGKTKGARPSQPRFTTLSHVLDKSALYGKGISPARMQSPLWPNPYPDSVAEFSV